MKLTRGERDTMFVVGGI